MKRMYNIEKYTHSYTHIRKIQSDFIYNIFIGHTTLSYYRVMRNSIVMGASKHGKKKKESLERRRERNHGEKKERKKKHRKKKERKKKKD